LNPPQAPSDSFIALSDSIFRQWKCLNKNSASEAAIFYLDYLRTLKHHGFKVFASQARDEENRPTSILLGVGTQCVVVIKNNVVTKKFPFEEILKWQIVFKTVVLVTGPPGSETEAFFKVEDAVQFGQIMRSIEIMADREREVGVVSKD